MRVVESLPSFKQSLPLAVKPREHNQLWSLVRSQDIFKFLIWRRCGVFVDLCDWISAEPGYHHYFSECSCACSAKSCELCSVKSCTNMAKAVG